jgi:hypothetical protein
MVIEAGEKIGKFCWKLLLLGKGSSKLSRTVAMGASPDPT